ncbi:MAG: GNAT family N-acetyltransferase [Anaerolineae bacterium]|nr:GNAT family N-acetyltransferase [Anaerolineae bacterium]
MHIIDFLPNSQDLIEQAATLLVEGFREDWPDAWPDRPSALETVNEAFAPERICRVAVDEAGTVLGWIGGIPEYDGLVWELHPLVVRADRRGQGIGKALVLDLEALVRAKGGLTLMLGSDDENNMTSLGGIDLYPDPLEHLRNIRNLKGHPFEFYQKLGFSLTGVVPDANGPGQPDILMAKSLR